MEAENEPDGVEEVDAVPVLADEARALQRADATAGVVVVKQAAAVAATSFAAGVVTVAAVRGARAVPRPPPVAPQGPASWRRCSRRARS